MEGLVIAAPMNELAVRNAKYAGECTELHLGGKGLTALHDVTEERKNDFEQFVSLEVLWINSNRLTRIEGLDANFRCKVLYAHNNKIASLRNSSISSMTFLNTLTLADNQLSDFMGTLEVLRRQNHLRTLDMSGNPIAEEKDYRLHVLQQLKGLEVLDKHKITTEERAAAAKIKPLSAQIDLMGGSSNGGGQQQAQEGTAPAVTAVGGTPEGEGGGTAAINQGTFAATQAAGSSAAAVITADTKAETTTNLEGSTGIATAAAAGATDSGAAAAAATAMACGTTGTAEAAAGSATKAGRGAAVLVLMRRHVADKRVCLKPLFQALDPRNEMVVRDDVAVTLLHTHQLWPMPAVDDEDANGGKVIPGPEKWPTAGGSEDEKLTLDQESLLARYAAPTPVRCKLLGRDPQAVRGHRFIDYAKLCHDLEPKAGGRDMDDLERRMAVEWKLHAPAKSVVTRLLEKEVHAYQNRLRAEEEALRLAMGGVTTKNKNDDDGINPDDENNENLLDHQQNNPLKTIKKKGVGENGNTTGFEPQDLTAPQLSPWELHTLKGFFENAEKKLAEAKRDNSSSGAVEPDGGADAPPPAALPPLTGMLPRPELTKCLEQTTLLGRAFYLPQGSSAAAAGASPSASPPRSPTSSTGAAAAGSPRGGNKTDAASPNRTSASASAPSSPTAPTAPVLGNDSLALPDAAGRHAIYERVFKAMDMAEAAKGGQSDQSGAGSSATPLPGPEGRSWKVFLSAVVDGIKDNVTGLELLPPLQWAALPYHDLKDKADQLFAEAAALQRRVMTSSKESPEDLKTIGDLSSYATRLHKLQLAHGPPQVLSPTSEARASAAATARAAADDAAVAKAEDAAAAAAAAESGNKDGGGSSLGFSTGAGGSLLAVGKFKKMGHAADERERAAANHEDQSGGNKLPPLDNPPIPPSPNTLRARKLDKLRRKFRLSAAEAESMLGPAL